MRRRRRPTSSTTVVPPRPIPPMLSGRRSKRRDAGLAMIVRSIEGSGSVTLHERSCPVSFDEDHEEIGDCTCEPLTLEFGATA